MPHDSQDSGRIPLWQVLLDEWKINKGRGMMPPWEQLPENERWGLVHYIRSLASKK